jgi:hypothetical protein
VRFPVYSHVSPVLAAQRLRLGFVEKFILWRTATHRDDEKKDPHQRSALILSLYKEIYGPTVGQGKTPVRKVVPEPFYSRLQTTVSRAMKRLEGKGMLRVENAPPRRRPGAYRWRRVSYNLTREGQHFGRKLGRDQAWRSAHAVKRRGANSLELS